MKLEQNGCFLISEPSLINFSTANLIARYNKLDSDRGGDKDSIKKVARQSSFLSQLD